MNVTKIETKHSSIIVEELLAVWDYLQPVSTIVEATEQNFTQAESVHTRMNLPVVTLVATHCGKSAHKLQQTCCTARLREQQNHTIVLRIHKYYRDKKLLLPTRCAKGGLGCRCVADIVAGVKCGQSLSAALGCSGVLQRRAGGEVNCSSLARTP